MERKSTVENWERKLKTTAVYRALMVVFLVLAVVSAATAITLGVKFKNYKDSMVHPEWISIVLEIRQTSDSSQDNDVKLTAADYGGQNKIDGKWKGHSLADFLSAYPETFKLQNYGGELGSMLTGIKGLGNDTSEPFRYWKIYSSTDPHGVENPDETTPVGISWMYLQDANVFSFAFGTYS
jgi:hypothetical protein